MEENRRPRQSEFFTVRLWPEELAGGQIEWRGRVQHPLSGRVGYFREGATLLTFFADFLEAEASQTKSTSET